MNLVDLRVIVVGGGIGGAAVSLLLAKAGAHVTLLEKVDNPRAVGAGIALAGNGLTVLDAIGLGPAIRSACVSVGAACIVDGNGRPILTPSEPRPEIAMIRRATLQQILLEAATSEPRIDLRLGAAVQGASREGSVRISLDGSEEHLEADLVVGADGVHSAVRENGNFGSRVSPPGIAYVRGLAPAGLHSNEEAWTAAGLFGSFPADDATYFYASAGSSTCNAAVDAQDLTAFRAAWARAYPPAGAVLGALQSWDDLIVNRVIRVDCNRWYDGRLVLLGDAAHAMAPNMGQGGNSALVDAAILTRMLRELDTMADALAEYDARRRPAVRKVADLSGRLGLLAEQTNVAVRWLRDRVLMPVANRMTDERAYAAILQESPAELLKAGDRKEESI